MAKEWLPNGAEWQESGPENTAGIEMAKGSPVRSNNQYSKTVLLVLTVNRANSWRSISCQSSVCQCVPVCAGSNKPSGGSPALDQ